MPQITNPKGAFGYTAPEPSSGWLSLDFQTSAAVTAGYIVSITATGAIQTAVSNGQRVPVFGVAAESATTVGKVVKVVRYGPITVTKDSSAFSAGDCVGLSATTNGVATVITAATAVTQNKDLRLSFGVATAAATAGATSVQVFVNP